MSASGVQVYEPSLASIMLRMTGASRKPRLVCVQVAPKSVEQPPSSEACMLGELKQLIDQLDQQTKATMKDSLYRISRHAQVPSFHPVNTSPGASLHLAGFAVVLALPLVSAV